MAISFSRTVRGLQQESKGHTWLAMFTVGLLLELWLAWFLLYPMAVRETAVSLTLQNSSQAVAIFPAELFLQLETGQSAQLTLDDFPASEYGTVTAVIDTIDDSVVNGTIQAILQLQSDSNSLVPLQAGLTGNVAVDMGQATPAELLWQTLGQRDGEAENDGR